MILRGRRRLLHRQLPLPFGLLSGRHRGGHQRLERVCREERSAPGRRVFSWLNSSIRFVFPYSFIQMMYSNASSKCLKLLEACLSCFGFTSCMDLGGQDLEDGGSFPHLSHAAGSGDGYWKGWEELWKDLWRDLWQAKQPFYYCYIIIVIVNILIVNIVLIAIFMFVILFRLFWKQGMYEPRRRKQNCVAKVWTTIWTLGTANGLQF